MSPSQPALSPRKLWRFAPWAVTAAALTLVLPWDGWAGNANDAMNRYPYDPACGWGRLADGRGMIDRCLTEKEARSLRGGAPAVSSATPPQPPASAAAVKPTPAPSSAASVAAPAPSAGTEPPPTLKVKATVLAVQVDQGALPLATKKLSAPTDRYQACVEKEGGLKGSKGNVKVRFLVRERGRAEGAAVAGYQGLSAAAARCVAEVIDRRFVGEPDEMLVAATVTVEFQAGNGATTP